MSENELFAASYDDQHDIPKMLNGLSRAHFESLFICPLKIKVVYCTKCTLVKASTVKWYTKQELDEIIYVRQCENTEPSSHPQSPQSKPCRGLIHLLFRCYSMFVLAVNSSILNDNSVNKYQLILFHWISDDKKYFVAAPPAPTSSWKMQNATSLYYGTDNLKGNFKGILNKLWL